MKKLIAITLVLLMAPIMAGAVSVQTSWAHWSENVDSSKIYIYSWDGQTILDSQATSERTSSLIDYDTTLSLNLDDSSYQVTILLFYPGANGGSRWSKLYVAGDVATQNVNLIEIGGVAQSATDLKDFADDGYDPATNLASADMVRLSGVALAADNLEEAFDNDNTGPTMTLRALNIVAGGTDSSAVNLHGVTAGAGLSASGGITGPGVEFIGGITSGGGLVITSNDGDGINISAGANGHGVLIVGAGTGDGMNIRSGSGATGDGMDIASAATNGDGMKLVGAGEGAGFKSTGGATGSGIIANAGASATTTDAGFLIQGANTSDGLYVRSGTGANADAVLIEGLSATGLNITGFGNGPGMKITGAGTGDGLNIRSGSGATGDGVDIASAATNGDGMKLVGVGTGKDLNAPDFAGIVADSVLDKDTVDAFAIAGGFGKFVKDSTQGAAGSLTKEAVAREVWTIKSADDSTYAAETMGLNSKGWDAIGGSGTGSNTVVIGAQDSVATVHLVSSAKITVKTLAGSLVGTQQTASNGYTSWSLDVDTFLVWTTGGGHIWSPFDTIVVVTDPDTFLTKGSDIPAVASIQDNVCNVYGYVTDNDNNGVEHVTVTATLSNKKKRYNTCDSTLVIVNTEEAQTDDAGRFDIPLIYSGCLSGESWTFTITFPDGYSYTHNDSIPDSTSYRVIWIEN